MIGASRGLAGDHVHDAVGRPGNQVNTDASLQVYSGFSLLFYGWLTIPAGGLLGGLLATARRRAIRDPTPNPSLQWTPPG